MIKEAIKKMVNPGGFSVAIDRGIVTAVDKNEVTCDVRLVTDDTCILQGVKLKPVINDDDTTALGMILYPVIGSFVIVGKIDDDSADTVVLNTSQIESIALDTQTALKLLITSDGKLNLNSVLMTFNDGKNGGVPLADPLSDAISDLQKKVDSLIDSFNTHTHIGVSTGSGVSGIPKASGPDKTNTYMQSKDIQNSAIVQ